MPTLMFTRSMPVLDCPSRQKGCNQLTLFRIPIKRLMLRLQVMPGYRRVKRRKTVPRQPKSRKRSTSRATMASLTVPSSLLPSRTLVCLVERKRPGVTAFNRSALNAPQRSGMRLRQIQARWSQEAQRQVVAERATSTSKRAQRISGSLGWIAGAWWGTARAGQLEHGRRCCGRRGPCHSRSKLRSR